MEKGTGFLAAVITLSFILCLAAVTYGMYCLTEVLKNESVIRAIAAWIAQK